MQCDCKTCRVSKLRTDPPTELELHRIRRSRATGKTKNPTWYKAPKMPAPFVPEYSQEYPAFVRSMFTVQRACPPEIPALKYETTADYVAEFDKLNGLRR